MAFQKTNNTNGNKRNYRPQNNDRPRNQTLIFNLLVSGVNHNGIEYDINELYAIIDELSNNKTFEILSFPVQIARSLVDNDPERRGTMSVGFVRAASVADMKIDVNVLGKYVDMIENLPVDLGIAPRVLVRNGHVQSILGLDLVAK